jgi:16S rRNA processing protein RimM
MKASDCFSPGFIIKPHGLKGSITAKIKEAPRLFPKAGEVLFIERNGQTVPYMIENFSVKGDIIYLKLEGIDTPELAESLKGASLLLPREMAQKHSPDSPDRMVGYEVIDEESGLLGTLTDVLSSGTQETLCIKGKKNEILIPFVIPQVVYQINHGERKIFTRCPDGLLALFSGE